MSYSSLRLDLPYISPSQSQKHLTHNEALRALDLSVQLCVEGFDMETPPEGAVAGQVFALGANPVLEWSGQAHTLALREADGWSFRTPQPGWVASHVPSGALYLWTGSLWQISAANTQNLPHVGVNNLADDTNRLSVSAPATLLNHEGTDHRLVINKAETRATASLLFQNDWAGHAELGLSGSNSFSIKTSSDGNTWVEALRFDSEGHATGKAVQENNIDTTSGRLLSVGAFGIGNAISYNGADDFDTVPPGLCANASTGNVPNNAPEPGLRSWMGFTTRTSSIRALQVLGSQLGDTLYFRAQSSNWGSWNKLYATSNVLGGVSQSDGVPTGALFESGSNSNGSYLRYADGTQICTHDNGPITTPAAAFMGTVTKIDGDKLWIGRWF